jgi:hypothetical protein
MRSAMIKIPPIIFLIEKVIEIFSITDHLTLVIIINLNFLVNIKL